MRICFIGSGVERENTRLPGIEIDSIARVVRSQFDTLVFGGSTVGLMGAFAGAFQGCGGRVLSIVPNWLHELNQVFPGGEPVLVETLAERKQLMFEAVDAVLCYPGGVGTWDELCDLLARRAIDHAVHARPACPPIYLYNWEQFYAPLLLQIETAVEVGLIEARMVAMVRPFETADALEAILRAEDRTAQAGI